MTAKKGAAASIDLLPQTRYCVEGTVTEHDGHAIRGASIEVIGSNGQTTESGTDGSFHLEASQPVERINVARPQFVSRFIDGLAAEANRCRVLKIVLDRSVSLRGTVQDIHHTPLVGVEVGLSDGDLSHGIGARTLTDTSGQFKLAGFPTGAYFIAARRQDLVPRVVGPVEVTPDREATDITIVLDAGGELEGHVATVEGSDIAGATISVTTESGNEKTAKSDKLGRFRIKGLDARSVLLAVSAEGFEDHTSRVDVYSPVQVVLTVSGIVRGRAIDAVTRLPITDFTIGAHRFYDTMGNFVIPTGAASPINIVVSAEGYASYDAGAYRVLSGNVVELGDVALEAGASIHGIALDLSGRPLSGLPVHRAPASVDETGAIYSEARTAYTNSDGAFTFNHVAPGSWTIWANFGENNWATEVIEVDPHSTTPPVTLRATPPDDAPE